MKNILVRSLVIFAFIFTSCATNKKIDSDDDFSVEGAAPVGSDEVGSKSDDLALGDTEEIPPSDAASTEKAAAADNNLDSALESELNSLGDSTEGKVAEKTAADQPKDELSLDEPAAPSDELSLDEPTAQPPVAKTEPAAPAAEPLQPTEPAAEPTPPPPVVIAENPPAVPPAEPVPQAPPEPTAPPETPPIVDASAPATIDNVTYQANSNGGTIAVSANQPLKFTTRLNSTTNQFIVEVENSTIPKKLKRSLNTKDMASTIGSVDIYQKAGSNVARFVVQLRQGSPEPIVQPEGNSILIIGSGTVSVAKAQASGEPAQSGQGDRGGAPPETISTEEGTIQGGEGASGGGKVAGKADGKSGGTSAATTQDLRSSNIDGKSFLQADNEIVDLATPGIMSSDDLEEFLISNNKFYGKKISIETNKMDMRDALKFISEESGVNIIIDETVAGNVSMKLRNVPWDQALILLLKSKKLGFKRQGSVLRIGKVEEFKQEEREAIEMKEARRARSPFVVKRFFIGYADVKDLEGKIKTYLDALAGVQGSGSTAATAATGVTSTRSAGAAKKDNIGTVIADSRSNSLIVTDTEENMLKITKLIEALDTQPQQVLIEGKVVEAKEEFTRGLGVNWTTVATPTTTNSARIGINPALDAGSVVFDGGFTWGSLDVLGSLTARLALGEREDRVRVLSSPRIAVLSNAKATISQTAGFLIPKTVVTANGASTTTNEVVPVGVILDVTPLVSNEGTVSLNLNITRSFVARVDAKAPDERKASTQVIVKSGQTAVIGGIFESTNTIGKSGVPGFREIPILGTLFQAESETKSKNELVIFVTPTILKPVVGVEKKSSDIQ